MKTEPQGITLYCSCGKTTTPKATKIKARDSWNRNVVVNEAAELHARSMAAQAWEEAVKKLSDTILAGEKSLPDCLIDVKLCNPYKL